MMTVADLLTRGELGLELLTGGGDVRRPIRWVHASELEDPTPFLRGGELLLTLGMRLPPDRDTLDAYVGRLCRAGIVGLGFGVGLGHERVPEALLLAAEHHGLPLLEVPLSTPFVAISEVVAAGAASEQYGELRRSLDAYRALARAATERGVPGLVEGLARQLGGRAALLDRRGRPVAEAGDASLVAAAGLEVDVEACLERGGGPPRFLEQGSSHIAIQPVSVAGRLRGLLVAWRAGPFHACDQSVLAAGLALLSIELTASSALTSRERRLRASLLDRLEHRAIALGDARRQLRLAGLQDEQLWPLVALSERQVTPCLYDELLDDLEERGIPFLSRAEDRQIHFLTAECSDLADSVASRPGLAVGIGHPCAPEGLPAGFAQARGAASVAQMQRSSPLRYSDIEGFRLLLSRDASELSVFAARILDPLATGSRGELIITLRAWLAHNGHWDETARELGIHRNTLRYRLHRIEQLTGRSLDTTQSRVEFWLALQAEELLCGTKEAKEAAAKG